MDNIGDLLIQWFDEDKLRACIQLKSKCISYLGIISHNRLIKKDERKTNECCLENYKHTQTHTNTHMVFCTQQIILSLLSCDQ